MTKIFSFKELFVSIILGLGIFLLGFDSKVFSVVFYSLREVYQDTPEKLELIKSSCLIGKIIGVIFCGKLIDKRGRKAVVSFSFVLLFISLIGLAFIPLLPGLIFLFRPIQGIALGLLLIASPVLLLETIVQQTRGKYLIMLYSLGVIGVLIGFLISYLFDKYSLIEMRNMYLVYLLQVAFVSLYFLFNNKIPPNNYFISNDNNTEKTSLKLLFSRKWISVLTLLFASSIVYSIADNFALHYHTIESLNKEGIGNIVNYRLEIILAIVSLMGMLTAAFFGDKIGRKQSLIIGVIGLIVVSIFEVIQFAVIKNEGINILMNVLFCFLFSFSLASTLYLTILELLPLRIRGRGFSLFHILIMVFSGATLFLYQRISFGGKNHRTGIIIFGIVLIVCLLGVLLFKHILPETKDRELNK